MSGEIRSWWQACITERERAGMLKRYTSCAKEPKALYDRIGEDLDSSNEAIRNNAYWILVRLTPELINLLHEKETRNPGWKDREGKDQKTVNEGLDGSKCILKHLHIKFVKEHRFKVRDGNKKDPRPFLKETIENWKKDRDRKLDREVSLDYEAALEIPDPAGTPEDYIIETETYNDLWTEYKSFFRNRDAFDVFIAHHVDERPLEEIRERWGIPSDSAVRQRKSRINKEMVARRDEVFTSLLFGTRDRFLMEGKFPRSTLDPERFEEWVERAKVSIQAGIWLNGKAADGNNAVAVRPLTTGLRDAPAHIYLVAIKEDYQKMAVIETKQGHLWIPPGISNGNRQYNLGKCSGYVEKVINPTSEPQRNNYIFSLLIGSHAFPGLNDALDEVPNGYYVWLISNSYSFAKSCSYWPPSFHGSESRMSLL